jgi:putative addiction module component (TIGR02574 family)
MKSKAERILEEALTLPEPSRAEIAGILLDSLEGEAVDPGYEQAWSREIARRIQEIDSGKVKLIPWSQVRRDILKSRREKKRRQVSR